MVLESIYRHRIPQPLESIGFCLNSSFELKLTTKGKEKKDSSLPLLGLNLDFRRSKPFPLIYDSVIAKRSSF